MPARLTNHRLSRGLIALFVALQALDAVTWLAMDAGHVEINPIVIALGPIALVGKAIMVAFVVFLAVRVPSPSMTAILWFGTALGVLGALSNTL